MILVGSPNSPNDASNYEEALKMGLAIKRPEKAAEGPDKGLREFRLILSCLAQAVLIPVPPRHEPADS